MKKDNFSAGLEDVVRVHDECLLGIAALLNGKSILVEGRECLIEVRSDKGAILADLLNPTDNLPRLEFRMVYTGGR